MTDDKIMTALTSALIGIQSELAEIKKGLTTNGRTSGFCSAPRPKYIYCNRSQGGVWYILSDSPGANGKRTPIPIEQTALECTIQLLEFKSVERRGSDTWKMHLHVKDAFSDQKFILESGSEAHFTKGILSSIATMTVEQLRKSVIIESQPAPDSEEVLFGRIYSGNELVFAPYNEQTDFRPIAKTAIDNVNRANGKQ